jgi:hypothetical protein
VVATANTVRIMWWSPCEVTLSWAESSVEPKGVGETDPAAAPWWRQYPATNTDIMTLFQGRTGSAAA